MKRTKVYEVIAYLDDYVSTKKTLFINKSKSKCLEFIKKNLMYEGSDMIVHPSNSDTTLVELVKDNRYSIKPLYDLDIDDICIKETPCIEYMGNYYIQLHLKGDYEDCC